MSLQIRIIDDLKAAMKAKDDARVQTLRMLRAALQNAEIEKRGTTGGAVVMALEEQLNALRKEAKKRKDAMEAYRIGDRLDRAKKEEAELAIIEEYLPKGLSEEDVRSMVRDAIRESGATAKDFGRVMGTAMRQIQGRADGNVVSKIVKQELGT